MTQATNHPSGFASAVGLVLGLALLPWIAVTLMAAGWLATLHMAGYAILVTAVGFAFISVLLPAQARSRAILFAPSGGVLTLSAVTAFWLRLGLPLVWVSSVWILLAAIGLFFLWISRVDLGKVKIENGVALVLLSALICGIYFVPSAFRDAVLRHDGSFNWIYEDDQYFHSMATSIEYSQGPPRMPGTSTSELLYHFGAYSLPAAISRFTGLNLGDALARVTRGVSQWALVFSCFGLGTILSVIATGQRFGGILSVAGLFFYGSILSLFDRTPTLASNVSGPILFEIPEISVIVSGGPFAQFILGHSMLHGLGAVTVILGMCLSVRDLEIADAWRRALFVVLPALTVPVHSVAALYTLGVVGILLFAENLKKARTWVSISAMFGLFLVAVKIMGYAHAPHASGATLARDLPSRWWPLIIWFFVGLGIRIGGFSWVSAPGNRALAMLVLAGLFGFLSFALLIRLHDGNERYGLYYLQAMMSIFAFSRLPAGFFREAQRTKWVTEWLGLATRIMPFLIIAGILAAVGNYAVFRRSGIIAFRPKMVGAILLLSFFAIMPKFMKNKGPLAGAGSACVAGVLLVGFLAWMTPWINYGLGRQKRDIVLTSGEVRGLKRFNELSAPGERFATNKRVVDSMLTKKAFSYAYGALSCRPVLLEGYENAGEDLLPGFDRLLHDNDLLFTTTNSTVMHETAKNYNVRWLVARPGTDIALPKPLPPWLTEEKDVGDLKIYRID